MAPRDLDRHLYLEILVNDKWVTLDCSDDSKLPGFNRWDGKSNCRIGVKAIKKYSPRESQKIEQEMWANFKTVIHRYRRLYKALNQFLAELRKRTA